MSLWFILLFFVVLLFFCSLEKEEEEEKEEGREEEEEEEEEGGGCSVCLSDPKLGSHMLRSVLKSFARLHAARFGVDARQNESEGGIEAMCTL